VKSLLGFDWVMLHLPQARPIGRPAALCVKAADPIPSRLAGQNCREFEDFRGGFPILLKYFDVFP
jgi:hypothetical protein